MAGRASAIVPERYGFIIDSRDSESSHRSDPSRIIRRSPASSIASRAALIAASNAVSSFRTPIPVLPNLYLGSRLPLPPFRLTPVASAR